MGEEPTLNFGFGHLSTSYSLNLGIFLNFKNPTFQPKVLPEIRGGIWYILEVLRHFGGGRRFKALLFIARFKRKEVV